MSNNISTSVDFPSSCIALTTDGNSVEPDLRIQLPGRCLISGQSGSGKSSLLIDILLNKDSSKINGTFKKIFWFYNGLYNQQTELFEKLSSDATVPVEFINRPIEEVLGAENRLDAFTDCILVFDDLWDVVTENATIKSICLQYSRQLRFSVFFLSQVRMKVFSFTAVAPCFCSKSKRSLF